MSRDNMIWLIVFVIGAAALLGRAMFSQNGMGKAYVHAVQVDRVNVGDADNPEWTSVADAQENGAQIPPEGSADRITWTRYEAADYKEFHEAEAKAQQDGTVQTEFLFSFWRSIGVWIAAALTLFVLSFLIKDNPFYKIAESIFIGISAAYWMVVAFWTTLIPNLVAPLAPNLVRATVLPGLGEGATANLFYIIPLILGVMLLWRLMPVGGWISRWPMAFFIGVFCGLRLVTFFHADFLNQINNTIVPLVATESPASSSPAWISFQNIILVIGVLACLVYFFFSIEHTGVVGGTARVGIWFLMITFGAAFGYTVMGRIALLAIRIEFLLDDWLWLIDPRGIRPPGL